MKNTRKGFTLVELLAVIVILAIIMIIAIPAVLSTMQTARQKSFAEYVTKVYTAAQNKYMTEKATTGVPTTRQVTGESAIETGTGDKKVSWVCYNYDIKKDIDLTSTGDFRGNVVICEANSASNGSIQILVRLADNNYHIKSNSATSDLWNYTLKNEPKADAGNIEVGKETATWKETLTVSHITEALKGTGM